MPILRPWTSSTRTTCICRSMAVRPNGTSCSSCRWINFWPATARTFGRRRTWPNAYWPKYPNKWLASWNQEDTNRIQSITIFSQVHPLCELWFMSSGQHAQMAKWRLSDEMNRRCGESAVMTTKTTIMAMATAGSRSAGLTKRRMRQAFTDAIAHQFEVNRR